MTAVWMLYCVGIGLAFVVMGYALERGLHLAGRPTRWAWVIALLGAYVVPAAAWLRPDAFATFAVPVPTAVESSQALPPSMSSTTSTVLSQASSRSFLLSDLDTPLRWGWGLASVALLITLILTATRLARLEGRWRQAAVDGRAVLVSRDVGPAVVGLWAPRIVVPEWALSLPASDRELMLTHEEEHLHARDPVLLAVGFIAVWLAPWNPASWWQWRRLRLAVETDCDARVLASGRSAPAYGELLLSVGRRRSRQTLGVAALGEPVSFLEYRIRRMLATMPRWRWAEVAAAMIVTVAAMVGACEAPRPVGPVQQATEPAAATSGISPFFIAVIEPTDIDQPPAIVSAGTAFFPDLVRLAGIGGPVVVQARIDVDGRVDAHSLTVLKSPHAALAQSAKSALLRSIFGPARAHGRVVSALVQVTYVFDLSASTPQGMRTLTDRLAPQEAQRLRAWIESNARRMVPAILEPSGPPMVAYLIHDSRLQVYRATVTTFHLLEGRGRPHERVYLVDSADLKRALQFLDPGHDGWAVVDPRDLGGLVRDNVQIIRIHHDPQPQDTMSGSPNGPSTDEMSRRANQVRGLARAYHPAAYRGSTSPTAVGLVIDSRSKVVGHGAAMGEARAPDGRYLNGESCLDVLIRLVPQFRNAQWDQSGCAADDRKSNVVVYWGIPLGR